LATGAKKVKPTPWARTKKYFREVRAELRKVAWPNRKEMRNFTTVVLLTVIAAGVFIGVVDFILSNLIGLLRQIGGKGPIWSLHHEREVKRE